ncbi:putative glycosyl [Golovinomyces cichoracearum]|uniref:Putative glycosyl n=1 Tax=Golovinomyces cichoracearum TaxID=62708 RepID=A0A420I778_9PEZI|nr:putative glycosyl [Golovinomyces cichoracearum]
MKLYNDEAKYGGSSSDLFDYKFETFCENCDMTCIGEEDRNRTFRFMLKKNALEHHRALIRENNGKEHEQMLLAKWNELSLQSIINEQEGSKDAEKALATLTTKLRTIQSGLNQSFRNSSYLYAKLLTACRGHPATRVACSTYSSNNNVTDLLNQLQASIATWKAELSLYQQAQVQYPL